MSDRPNRYNSYPTRGVNTHYELTLRPEREEVDLSEEHSELKKNRSQKRNRKDKDYKRKYEDESDDWN
jgi:hypothetical protein